MSDMSLPLRVFARARSERDFLIPVHGFAGAYVSSTDYHGTTAMMYAAENGHTEVARLLLQAGSDLGHHNKVFLKLSPEITVSCFLLQRAKSQVQSIVSEISLILKHLQIPFETEAGVHVLNLKFRSCKSLSILSRLASSIIQLNSIRFDSVRC